MNIINSNVDWYQQQNMSFYKNQSPAYNPSDFVEAILISTE